MIFNENHQSFIIENIKGITTNELLDKLNKTFNTNFNINQLRSYKSKNKLRNDVNTQFKKNHTSFNKGKKWDDFMSKDSQQKSLATTFKKGDIPKNYRPVGSERVNVYGYVEVKVADPNKWDLKHRVLWESINGSIPKDHVLLFLDQDKLNITIDNLILVSKAHRAIINKNKLTSSNPKYTKTGLLVAELMALSSKKSDEIET